MNSEMTIERAAEVLKAHNEWRRDVTDNPPATTRNMQDPEDIGRAIDVAVRELEKIVMSDKEPQSLAEAFGCE